jgi:hypothetical protein
MKAPPKTTVGSMPASAFFAYAGEILKLRPPHIADQPILAEMWRIGLEMDENFDADTVALSIKAGFLAAPRAARHLPVLVALLVALAVTPHLS